MRASRFSLFIAGIALALLALGSGRATAQILLNGSFEAPPISEIQPGAGADWTSPAPAHVFLITNNYSLAGGDVGITPYGSQFVGINKGASISQVITGFVAGQQYVLGADFAGLPGEASSNFTMLVSGAAFDGTSVSTSAYAFLRTKPDPVPVDRPFLYREFDWQCHDHPRRFGRRGNGILVDNVALYSNPTPEPATYAEILVGLVALAGFARFRRRSALARLLSTARSRAGRAFLNFWGNRVVLYSKCEGPPWVYPVIYLFAPLLVFAGMPLLRADTAAMPADALRYDWLQPIEEQRLANAGGTFTSISGTDLKDPFAVVSSGALWQDKQGTIYSRPLMDQLAVTCATSRTTQDGVATVIGRDANVSAAYKPVDALSLQGNVHNSTNDPGLAPVTTSGASGAAEAHLPLGSIVNFAAASDQTRSNNPGLDVDTNAYDAQLQKPVGKLPLTAVLKGHYVETATPGTGATKIPSLEQSLVWKPANDMTLQAGLRQQQYQDFPGISRELNQALFADWSQSLADNVSWHSYAEVLNSRSTIQFAEAGAGANGTAQPNTPGAATLGSALPVSITDEKFTFSTGPSVMLQKDISASLQYSNSWDQNPARAVPRRNNAFPFRSKGRSEKNVILSGGESLGFFSHEVNPSRSRRT